MASYALQRVEMIWYMPTTPVTKRDRRHCAYIKGVLPSLSPFRVNYLLVQSNQFYCAQHPRQRLARQNPPSIRRGYTMIHTLALCQTYPITLCERNTGSIQVTHPQILTANGRTALNIRIVMRQLVPKDRPSAHGIAPQCLLLPFILSRCILPPLQLNISQTAVVY